MDIPNDPPDDQLGPGELHDRVEATVNLDVEELEAFQDSQFNESYLEQASEAAQPGDEPLEDTIQLLETPRYQYEDVDDGFNEVDQSLELLDFQRRTQAQIESQGLGRNFLTDLEVMQKREAASIRWGIDPDEEREWL